MTREKFIDFTKDHIIYLDGATGSNLVKAGMPSGVCPEQWILEHREVMLQLQKEYVQAGTNILYAPTFTANRVKLAEYHLEKNMSSMIHDLVAISKEAAASTPGHPVYVAGDITMTGEQLRPMGKMELEDLIAIYKEQILCLVDAGADLLVVETMMSLAETRAALIAAKEVCDLPVIATLTLKRMAELYSAQMPNGGSRTGKPGCERYRCELFHRSGTDGRHHLRHGIRYHDTYHCKAKCRTAFSG